MTWDGGTVWWHVGTEGGVHGWRPRVVKRGISGNVIKRCAVEGVVRTWQKRLLSARDSKLILMHKKLGLPSSLSMMLIWCGCDDMLGPLPEPVIAAFIEFRYSVHVSTTVSPPALDSLCRGGVWPHDNRMGNCLLERFFVSINHPSDKIQPWGVLPLRV